MVGFPVTARVMCNAAGPTSREVWKTVEAGRSGLALQLSDVTGYVGEFSGVEPLPEAFIARDSRLARILGSAVAQISDPIARACQRWGSSRVGAVLGTTTGILAGLEGESTGQGFDSRHAPQALVELLREMTGLRGPAYALGGGWAAGARAFAAAKRLLDADVVDAVVVGGVDSPSKAVERLFAGRRWLSTERCRPFGARRDGTSLGEGAALILLERQGEATVELLAVAEARPRGGPALEAAVHLTAMRNALQAGAVPPERVGCLHAQACGFARADAVEAQAFQAMFGSRVPLLASAGATGHLLGAAAATGVALAASCLEAGIVPVSVGLDGMRTTPARLEGDFAVVHAWGLDGSAVSIVLGVRDL